MSQVIDPKARALSVFIRWAMDTSTLGGLEKLEAAMLAEGISLIEVGQWCAPPAVIPGLDPGTYGAATSNAGPPSPSRHHADSAHGAEFPEPPGAWDFQP